MLKTKERKTDGRGKHPNSLANLKFIKPGEALNPHGRPPGTTYSLLAPLIRVIKEQQSLLDEQGEQISTLVNDLVQGRNEREQKASSSFTQEYDRLRLRLIELEKDLKHEQGQGACWQKSYKAVNELKDDLEKQLTLMTEIADKRLEELKPYREAKIQESTSKIEMKSAGYARR